MTTATDRMDCVVIGAGAVGLAVARALALQGREVLILEAAGKFGVGVSSRSSEVIHAGLYYPHGSLKAKFCVTGREQLYRFCARAGVGHRCCGKLIVATSDEQIADLQSIHRTAGINGVGLDWLDAREVREMEPEVSCVAALFSPLTGIIDSHGYMRALLGEAEARGAVIAYHHRVTRMWPQDSGVAIAVNDAGKPTLRANTVINCASLHASAVAASIDSFPKQYIPRTHYARGHYFSLTRRAPFRHLIYPIPIPGGLGVHLTLDLAGQARFGPDVEWVDDLDYHVCITRAERFYTAVRRFWPGLEDGQLIPAYAGIRPKISGPDEPAVDFRIEGPHTHGVTGVINLFGIESPGLTGSLAIADHVAQMAHTASLH